MGIPQTKRCSKCGKEKPFSEFYYRKSNVRYDSVCRECKKESERKYYIKHRDEILRKAKIEPYIKVSKKNGHMYTVNGRSVNLIWTDEMVNVLIDNIDTHTCKEIGMKLNLSVFAIYKKKKELGLTKHINNNSEIRKQISQ